MIEYLKRWIAYITQESIKNTNDSDNQLTENYLIISCDETKNSKIKINFHLSSTEAAKQFGEMLFLLNEGYYVQSILDIFNEASKANEQHAKFIQSVIAHWSEKVLELENHEEDAMNSPIVSPTYFYKSAKQ